MCNSEIAIDQLNIIQIAEEIGLIFTGEFEEGKAQFIGLQSLHNELDLILSK